MEEDFVPSFRNFYEENFFSEDFINDIYKTEFIDRGITIPHTMLNYDGLCTSIFATNNVYALHKTLDHLMDDNALEEYIASPAFLNIPGRFKNKNDTNITDIRKKIIDITASRNALYRMTDIMRVLIVDYGFVPDEYFMKATIQNNSITMEILKVFHEYFDMRKYRRQICLLFRNMCRANYVDNIKILIGIGYDIHDLSNETINSPNDNVLINACYNSEESILEFLLDQGIDFHVFEADLLHCCIRLQKYKHLQVLLDYGADIKSLQNYKIAIEPEFTNMVNLLSQDLDILKIVGLLL